MTRWWHGTRLRHPDGLRSEMQTRRRGPYGPKRPSPEWTELLAYPAYLAS